MRFKNHLKLIVLIGTLYFLIALIAYVVSNLVVMKGFEAVEKQDYETKQKILENAINAEKESLKGQNLDWSVWDDSYNFVLNKNQDYVDVNVNPEMLANLKIDFFAVLDKEYNVVFIQAHDSEGNEIRTEVDKTLIENIQNSTKYFEKNKKDDTDTTEVFYDLNGMPILTTVSNIIKSDSSGPPAGYMLMGEYINAEKIKIISERNSLNLSYVGFDTLKKDNSTVAKALESTDSFIEYKHSKAYSYVVIKDYNNQKIGVIKSEFDRKVNTTAKSTQFFSLVSIYIIAFIAAVITIIIFIRLESTKLKQFEGETKYQMLFNENVMPLFLIKLDKNWTWTSIVEQNNAASNLYRENDWLDIKNKPINILYGMEGVQIKDFVSTLATVGLSTAQTDLIFGQSKLAVEIIGRVFKIEDQKYLLLSIKDLSERVNYERRLEDYAGNLKKFQLAVENASDQIIITDPEGIILYANKSLKAISGFDVKEVVGKKAGTSGLWGGLMDREFYEKLWRTIDTEKQSYNGELKNKRKDGEEYDAALSVSPILDERNNVLFYVGIERDITKAKEVDRAKTEFVSLASHQLRTPLSSINWFTEMLLSGDAGETNKTQKEYLNEIYKGNKRMVSLVNALLNASRIELGTFGVEPEPSDIVAISKDVIEELEPLIKERQVYVVEDYEEMPQIMLDPKLTRIIFQNLLTNAVKYTGGRGKVTVTIKKDNEYVTISVADTGFGIPPDQQEKVFTKLFRADNIKALDAEGSGLGLYIVKSIVEESNGKIWFESEENKGTTFYVSLPTNGMKGRAGSKPLE
ncbi:MAG: CHASE4 domain-containing protein [Patescibacteria group bacterium]|jgi:PAS domain S-box-containing protein|nr:CHASE4 domain-containing protein [Patescibacteria group bacterium]